MNKIVASLGMVALGAAGIQSVSAQDTGAPASKPWNISATLRGFYDDNINTVEDSSPDHQKVYGVEISPAAGFKWLAEGTSISLNYRLGVKYYDKNVGARTDRADIDHIFTALVDHAFNERFKVGLTDSFVIGQEPDSLRVGPFATVQRVSGNNIRNYGTVTFNAQLTPTFGLEAGYANQWFDYRDEGGDAFLPSASGILDRVEHRIHLDGRFLLQPQTVAVLGYQFGETDYTANEDIGGILSDERNSRSHYGYVGLDHSFRPDLSASVRGGVQYIDFYNDPNSDSEYSPYVQASLKYTYAEESSVQVGLTQSRSATDVVGVSGSGDFVHDSDTTVVFGSIYHRIVPNLFGSLMGTFQNSSFNGGAFDGDTEQYLQLGVNLQYRFNSYLSSEVGYNYDKLDSDINGRNFDRNRVYIGLTASY